MPHTPRSQPESNFQKGRKKKEQAAAVRLEKMKKEPVKSLKEVLSIYEGFERVRIDKGIMFVKQK